MDELVEIGDVAGGVFESCGVPCVPSPKGWTKLAPSWAARIYDALPVNTPTDRRALRAAARSEEHRGAILALVEPARSSTVTNDERVSAYLDSIEAP